MVTEDKEVAFVFETKRLIESLGTEIVGIASKYDRQVHFSSDFYAIL